MRPIRLADGWRGWTLSDLPDGFDPLDDGGRVLKDDGNSRVVLRDGLVLKRPTPPVGTRRLLARLRRPRAVRAWLKTVVLQGFGLPVEPPVLCVRRGVEAIGVYREVPGTTLADIDLETLTNREATLEQIGRVLRRTADLGWTHLDAKSTNWMITPDGEPVMLDCDGLRRTPLHTRRRRGLDRLLRALRDHPQFSEDDEQAVLSGFGEDP